LPLKKSGVCIIHRSSYFYIFISNWNDRQKR